MRRTRVITTVTLVVALFVAGIMSPIAAWAEEGAGHSGARPVSQVESLRGSASVGGEPVPESPSMVASVVIAGISVASLLSVPMTMRRLAKADDEESGEMDDETRHSGWYDCDDMRDGDFDDRPRPTDEDAYGIEDDKVLLDGGHTEESV